MANPVDDSQDLLFSIDDRDQQIDFIIERRHGIPSARYVLGLTQEQQDDLIPEEIKAERNVFFDDIAALHPGELADLYAHERSELRREIALYLKPAPENRLDHWLKMDAWLPAEAVILWFGSEPVSGVDLSTWAERNGRLTGSAVEVAERWQLIRRALWVGLLKEPLHPLTFIQWAATKGRPLPTSFTRALFETGQTTASDSSDMDQSSENALLREQVKQLGDKLIELNKPHYKLSLKLFGALCVGIYGYDTEKSRNKATKIITDVLRDHWNGRVEKSVLEYIRSAVLELPQGGKKFARLHMDDG